MLVLNELGINSKSSSCERWWWLEFPGKVEKGIVGAQLTGCGNEFNVEGEN